MNTDAYRFKQEAINQLKELQKSGNTEAAHSKADNIVCELLKQFGHEDIVTEYKKVDKWYA